MTNKYFPDYVSPPGATLLDMLEEIEMSKHEAAFRLDMTTEELESFFKGDAYLNESLAISLESAFRVPRSFWLNREKLYRDSLLKRTT